MNRRTFVGSCLATFQALRSRMVAQVARPPEGHNKRLWSRIPARYWLEAFPLGNGRLGAMVYGDPGDERIVLNEDTLYSDEPGHSDLPLDLTKDLDRIRAMIRAEQYAEADAYVTRHWLGRAQPCYQPLGALRITSSRAINDAWEYYRELDLREAICRVRYVHDGVRFDREYLASYPDDLLMMRFRSDRKGALSFRMFFESPHPALSVTSERGNTLAISGQMPGFALRRELEWVERKGDQWKYPEIWDRDGRRKPGAGRVMYGAQVGGRGLRFEVRLLASVEGGDVSVSEGSIRVSEASEVTLRLAAVSSFNGFDKSPTREGIDPAAKNRATLSRSVAKTFEQVRTAHITDYQTLFDRVVLDISSTPGRASRPLEQRLRSYVERQDDPELEALYFDYGRYLIIASSRPGSQPMNLQGIWNVDVIPPWAGAYTTNINIQMNYWPVDVTNLSECNEPLVRFVEEASVNGAKAAREMYRRPGWVLHHNTTIWRGAQTVDNQAIASYWPMASGWLCQHLWDHYLFTLDRTFLEKRAYPLMKGAAQFYSAWLVEDESGHLTTPVSTSPENGFSYVDSSGQRREAAVSKGTLLDIAIIRELFSNVIEAGKLLGVDSDLRGTLSAQLRRLQEYQVGSSGELLEWFKEFGPIGPRHNTSPFYPLYPGSEITEATPRLWQAVRQLLLSRHRTTGGWPAAWTSCCWARLGDATRAHESYRSILARTSHPNLFNGHDNIFQVDGNLGAVAAVAEMLLQSHAGALHLLPGLPPAWPSGRVKGLRARGGFEVDILWRNGLLTEAVVRASRDAKANLRYRDRTTSLDLHAGRDYKIGADLQVLG